MHMAGPGLTTTNYNGNGKKIPNTAKARAAKAKHDAWLRNQGLHPEQLELQKAFRGVHKNVMPHLTVTNNIPLGNNIAVDGGYRHGVLDNLRHESPATQKEILDKASRIDIAYNKGPLIYCSPGTDTSQMGSRSRRG